MTRIPGISFIYNKKGERVKIVIDIKKHYSFVEDLIDHFDVLSVKNEETIPWEEVQKEFSNKKKKNKM